MSAEDDAPTQVVTGTPAPAPEATVLVPDATTQATQAAPASASRGSAEPAPEAGLLPIGSRIAEFEVTRIVGQGGFGVVYECWDTDLERVVAVKEYLPVSLSTRQADGTVSPLSERTRETFELGMRSFINEARLLAQFDHPSLLKVLRFWQERGTTYMAMPFYRGRTLRQTLADMPGGVKEPWLLSILEGVTQALAVMHAAQCYHRDIAPDNIILLEDTGRPVLLDFGAARRVITDKTQAITVILKPGYAPVEQYAEMPDMSQGAWTDVYALAAVMHVAVVGRAPPPSVARLLADSYVPLAQHEGLSQIYSPRLLATIDAGLGVRPEARPQSMAAFRALLGLDDAGAAPARPSASRADDERTVILSAAGGTATAPAVLPQSGSAARKPIVLAGGVLALAVAGAVAWWSMRTPPPVPAGGGDAAVVANGAAQAIGNAATPGTTDSPATPANATDSTTTAAATPSSSTTPTATPRPVTPLESLQSLARGATPGFSVSATPRKAEVAIGKDKLAFDVRSNREGYVYVFLLSSGNELFQLFPNLLDKYNKIAPNTPLALPRAAWPMNSGGPPGANEFAVLVSEHERDFSQTGMQSDGVFPQFPLPALAALEAARGTGPAPLLGKAACPPNAPCRDVYGVGLFRIVEK